MGQAWKKHQIALNQTAAGCGQKRNSKDAGNSPGEAADACDFDRFQVTEQARGLRERGPRDLFWL